jgi:DNA-binding transcriptional ArsR family regulator
VIIGMNRVNVALLCTLARHGGTCTTLQLTEALSPRSPAETPAQPRPDIPIQSIGRHLRELEQAGYISANTPLAERPGRRVLWTLNSPALHADLHDLIRMTTTPTDPEEDATQPR